MSKSFNLKVSTPNGVVFNSPVEQIVAESIDGELGILPDHMPLITPLTSAPLKYWSEGDIKVIAVLGGMMEVSKEGVNIISDHAALADNIDEVVAQKEKQLAEARIAQKKDTVDIQKAEKDLRALLLNLKAVEMARKIRR